MGALVRRSHAAERRGRKRNCQARTAGADSHHFRLVPEVGLWAGELDGRSSVSGGMGGWIQRDALWRAGANLASPHSSRATELPPVEGGRGVCRRGFFSPREPSRGEEPVDFHRGNPRGGKIGQILTANTRAGRGAGRFSSQTHGRGEDRADSHRKHARGVRSRQILTANTRAG